MNAHKNFLLTTKLTFINHEVYLQSVKDKTFVGQIVTGGKRSLCGCRRQNPTDGNELRPTFRGGNLTSC